jgi:hypothetical protein
MPRNTNPVPRYILLRVPSKMPVDGTTTTALACITKDADVEAVSDAHSPSSTGSVKESR